MTRFSTLVLGAVLASTSFFAFAETTPTMTKEQATAACDAEMVAQNVKPEDKVAMWNKCLADKGFPVTKAAE